MAQAFGGTLLFLYIVERVDHVKYSGAYEFCVVAMNHLEFSAKKIR